MPAYLRIGAEGAIKIKGEVMTAPYLQWMEVASVQLGTGGSSVTAPGRISAEKPQVSEIVVTKLLDTTSPSLFRFSVDGEPCPATIAFIETMGSLKYWREYLRVDMEGVLISSYSVSGASGADRPFESFTLEFTKMSFTRG